jgi:hypothetical protein
MAAISAANADARTGGATYRYDESVSWPLTSPASLAGPSGESGDSVSLELVLDGAGEQDAADLRNALMKAGAGAVEPVRVRQPPSDRRPAEVVGIVGLIVQTAGTLVQVIDTIRGWLGHKQVSSNSGAVPSITMVIDGDRVEITNPTTVQEQRLIDLFVQRHSIGAAHDGD